MTVISVATPTAPTAQTSNTERSPWPHRLLSASGVLWFLAAAAGQWIFVAYVAAAYIPPLAMHGLPGLEQSAMPDGYVEGGWLGNISAAFHALIAIIIIGGGPLQLIPALRKRFPAFHRAVGKIYMSTAILTSLAGAYLVATRANLPGGALAPIAMYLNAALIIAFAAIAFRYAAARQINQHRQWAMRLFIIVASVWFFRIGLMFWFMTTGGIGIDPETFTGPFITFIYFGQMFVPLAFMELYLRAQASKSAGFKLAAAGVTTLAAGATAFGVFAATMAMWLPRII